MIYVFNGNKVNFPSAVFDNMQQTQAWIYLNKLKGTLTKYPLNKRFFCSKTQQLTFSNFIRNFSSGSQEHFHYEDGIRIS